MQAQIVFFQRCKIDLIDDGVEEEVEMLKTFKASIDEVRRVPHDHGTPMGTDFLQGKIRVVGVLGVEVADIVAIKWEKEGREITLEEHRLGQEN
jgi:hypothetical protein